MELIKGQKIKLEQIISDVELSISCDIGIASGSELDMCCLGVDKDGKLSDDRYFIFYNALNSPEGAIIKESSSNIFHVNLNKVPDKIKRIVVCISIDGNATMKDIQSGKLMFLNNNNIVAEYKMSREKYTTEKSIILCEIYLKDGIWRLALVDSGFNGGLGDILRNYGGEESQESDVVENRIDGSNFVGSSSNNVNVKNNSMNQNSNDIQKTHTRTVHNIQEEPKKKIYLEKKKKVEKIVLEKAPHLIDLTKKVTITLEKKKLEDVTASVVVVLDRSGSMNRQYKNGDVQRSMDKLLPIALMFDDDGELDTWTFAESAQHLSRITLDNISGYITNESGGWKRWKVGGYNNEPVVMKELINMYKDNVFPVYIIFISDGGIHSKGPIKKLLIKSSVYPMFWQFVGIGGSNYGILEELDTMSGRVVDNANFFAIDNIDSLTDEQLYDKLLNEFPIWLKEAKLKRIVR